MGSIDLLEDACAAIPHTTRKMFGGHGLFATNGGMFAGVLDGDRIVLKFALATPDHDAFLAEGGEPWVYEGKGAPTTMREWLLVPDRLYDEPRALAAWAARAARAAPAKATKKSAPKAARAKAPKKAAPKKPKGAPKKAAKSSKKRR